MKENGEYSEQFLTLIGFRGLDPQKRLVYRKHNGEFLNGDSPGLHSKSATGTVDSFALKALTTVHVMHQGTKIIIHRSLHHFT